MKNEKPSKNSHLTLSDRIVIEQSLNEKYSFRQIAKKLNKSPSTISREVSMRRANKGKRTAKTLPKCALYKDCTVTGLCKDSHCVSYSCRSCSSCKEICKDYIPGKCTKIMSAPYVCNSCEKIKSCTYDRFLYIAKYADDEYRNMLIESREGLNQTPEQMSNIDKLVSPLIKNGQSVAHIYSSHAEEIGCSRTTLYTYINNCYLSARNIDLPRKVKYRPRNKSTAASEYSDASFKIGRTYEDFCEYMKENPHTQVVEMDTVIGTKESHKVLLTLFFRNCSLMLIILLPNKTSEAVVAALNMICDKVGIENFKRLFPVILTDNGTEFQNNPALECDINGEIKTRVYYCHPNCSWEKGMIEKNHEFIRYIVPKGRSFDGYTQDDIDIMMNHINSYARDSLNGCTPYKLSRYMLHSSIHEAMNLKEIPLDQVIMKPFLL